MTTNNKQQTTKGVLLASIACKLHLYNFLVYIEIDGLAHRFINKNLLKQSKAFFSANTEKINLIINMLADEESKRIYTKALLYRQTRLLYHRPDKSRGYQYFPHDIIYTNENEVFCDCGAFTGDTIQDFVKVTNNKFKKIVAFEPDSDNFMKLKELSDMDTRIVPLNSGVWDHSGSVDFYTGTSGSSRVQDVKNICGMNSGTHLVSIQVKAIDSVIECSDVTFIKMDVEGSEMNALKGALQTIKKNRPKLAICIYHSDDDMVNIPEYLYSNLDNYSFYIRQHSYTINETVLYAIPNN